MPTIDRSHVWESLAIEVDPADLLDSIILAEDNEDKERVESLLCGAVKMLRNNRTKPDQVSTVRARIPNIPIPNPFDYRTF